MGYSAAASIAGNVVGGLLQGNAASSASKQQAQALQKALAFTQGNYNTAQQNLSPFITTGQGAESQLAQLTGSNPGGNPLTAALTKQFTPADLANTPGYQFQLAQGEKATQNGLTAQGLGGSGQSTAGAINYAEGLAGTTYNQQLQNYLAQNQQTYNMLNTLAQGGQGAATNLGQLGVGAGQQVLQGETGVGNAQAAGTLGESNALTSGINGITSAINTNNLYSTLAQSGSLGALGGGNGIAAAALSNPTLGQTVNANSLGNLGSSLYKYLQNW